LPPGVENRKYSLLKPYITRFVDVAIICSVVVTLISAENEIYAVRYASALRFSFIGALPGQWHLAILLAQITRYVCCIIPRPVAFDNLSRLLMASYDETVGVIDGEKVVEIGWTISGLADILLQLEGAREQIEDAEPAHG
jgi:hypothetical protein